MNDVKMVARLLKADLSAALSAIVGKGEHDKAWRGIETMLKAQIAAEHGGYTDRGTDLPRSWSSQVSASEVASALALAREDSQEVRDLTHAILETADGSVLYVDADAIRATAEGLHALRGRHDATVRRLRASREDRATEESAAIRNVALVTPVLVLAIAATVAIHGAGAFANRDFDPTRPARA